MWDIHGSYIEASDELYELYNIDKTTPHFSTKTYLSILHPDDLSYVMRIVSNFWQVHHHQYEHRIVKPNGEIMYVSMNVESIRAETCFIIALRKPGSSTPGHVPLDFVTQGMMEMQHYIQKGC